MKVTFSNTTLDFERYFYRYQLDIFRPSFRFSGYLYVALFVLCAAVLGSGYKLGGVIGAIIAILVVGGITTASFSHGQVARYNTSVLVEQLPGAINQPKTIELSPEGVSLSSQSSEHFEPWSGIDSIDQEDDYLFMRSLGLVVSIPGSAFDSNTERQVFIDCALEYFEESRKQW